MKLEPPYQDLKDLILKIQDWWSETGRSRERVGELIKTRGHENLSARRGAARGAPDG